MESHHYPSSHQIERQQVRKENMEKKGKNPSSKKSLALPRQRQFRKERSYGQSLKQLAADFGWKKVRGRWMEVKESAAA